MFVSSYFNFQSTGFTCFIINTVSNFAFLLIFSRHSECAVFCKFLEHLWKRWHFLLLSVFSWPVHVFNVWSPCYVLSSPISSLVHKMYSCTLTLDKQSADTLYIELIVSLYIEETVQQLHSNRFIDNLTNKILTTIPCSFHVACSICNYALHLCNLVDVFIS